MLRMLAASSSVAVATASTLPEICSADVDAAMAWLAISSAVSQHCLLVEKMEEAPHFEVSRAMLAIATAWPSRSMTSFAAAARGLFGAVVGAAGGQSAGGTGLETLRHVSDVIASPAR